MLQEQLAGLLELQVIAACDLNGACLSGKRVFVTISFGKSCFKTACSLLEQANVWKQKCFIPVRKYEASYSLSIGLWQAQTLGKNKLLGKAEVSLQAFSHKDLPVKMAVKLLGKEQANGSASGEESGFYTLVNGEFFTPLLLKKHFWEVYFADYAIGTVARDTILELFRTCERFHFPEPVFEEIVKAIEAANAAEFPMQHILSTLLQHPIATREGETGIFIDFCPKCSICINSPAFEAGKKFNFQGEIGLLIHFAQCAEIHLDARYFTEENASRKRLTRYLNYVGIGAYSIGKHSGNILVQDRKTGKIVEEKIPVYIKLGLKMLYQHAKGIVSTATAASVFNAITKRQGVKYSSQKSAQWISSFVEYHGIKMEEFQVPPGNFTSFNDFFYRKLRPEARKVCSQDPAVAICPADCRLLCYESIGEATEFWIKGANFTATNLLQDPVMGAYYEGGSLAICRLAPQDYHRFHAPIDGWIWGMKTIDGALLTVNPVAVREQFDVFTENKRTVCYIRSERFGNVAFVAIGATMVGSVVMTAGAGEGSCSGQKLTRKFDEIGYFAFGGSTVVLLFPKQSICFDEDLLVNSRECLETLVQVGDSLGTLVKHI